MTGSDNTGGLFRSGKGCRSGKGGRPPAGGGRIICIIRIREPQLSAQLIGFPEAGASMNSVFSYPSQAYDYVYGHYGFAGVVCAGVGIVLGFVGLLVWFDRRK